MLNPREKIMLLFHNYVHIYTLRPCLPRQHQFILHLKLRCRDPFGSLALNLNYQNGGVLSAIIVRANGVENTPRVRCRDVQPPLLECRV